jgi:hypothetical protein
VIVFAPFAARSPTALLIPWIAVAGACTSTPEHPANAHADASSAADAGSLPPEERWVKLTLPPIFDLQETADGGGDPVSIGDVEVCIAKSRPWAGLWGDFEKVDLPCVTSVAGANVEFARAPGLAELLVTASKPGYIPGLFAVTTGHFDHDTTRSLDPYCTGCRTALSLHRSDPPWPGLPDNAIPSPDAGLLSSSGFLLYGISTRPITGLAVSLDRPGADGPFYTLGGKYVPQSAGTPAAHAGETGATFANIPEGEYEVIFELSGATCKNGGSPLGSTFFGFSSTRENAVRAPVLAGCWTQSINALCQCNSGTTTNLDAGTCGP